MDDAGTTHEATTKDAPLHLLPASEEQHALPDAGQVSSSAPTLEFAWRFPGLCEDGKGTTFERARYLASFVRIPADIPQLFVHRDVPASAIREIQSRILVTKRGVTTELQLNSDPPWIYVYPSVEALRRYSCASSVSVAYYDGAIHLAVLSSPDHSELRKSLAHEWVHHVLISNGIEKPSWFQEGAAMYLAGDMPRNWAELLRANPVVPSRMIDAFPKTAPLETATIFYAQAYAMTSFLNRLCLQRVRCGSSDLADALRTGRAQPERLFEWALSDRGSDLLHTTTLPLWDDFTQRGNLSQQTISVLLNRPPQRSP